MMDRRGFTLIELLIAVTILAIMMGIVYASFAGVVNATDSTRKEAKWLRRQQFLAHSFERNFSTAYIDRAAQQAVYQFVGTSEDGKDGPKDSVTFVSTAPLIGGGSLPGDMKQVHYELVDSSSSLELGYEERPDSDKRGSMIRATETPVLGSSLASQLNTTGTVAGGGLSQPNASSKSSTSTLSQDDTTMAPEWTLPEILSMDITYFDGVKFVDEWDSSTEGRLPWYVDVKINYWKPQEELDQERRDGLNAKDNPDFEMILPIALGLGVTQPAQPEDQMADNDSDKDPNKDPDKDPNKDPNKKPEKPK